MNKAIVNKLRERRLKLEKIYNTVHRLSVGLLILIVSMGLYVSLDLCLDCRVMYSTVTQQSTASMYNMTHATVTVIARSDQVNPWAPITPDGSPNYITWSGSGVVISDEGHIMTANHVLDGAVEVTVIDYSGNNYEVEEFKGVHYVDLGIIKIKAPNPLPVVSLANEGTGVGDTIYICGSSLGKFTNSLSKGIVGHNNRLCGDMGYTKPVFQMDASAYPGNSGGPVYNINGELVGILVAGVDSGLVFAIPIDQVRAMYEWYIVDKYFREL